MLPPSTLFTTDSLPFNFSGRLFNVKIPKYPNFNRSSLEQHVWGALVPQGDCESKNGIKQNVLRIQI